MLHMLQYRMERGFGVRFLALAGCGRKTNMTQLQVFFLPRPISSGKVPVCGEKLQPFLMLFEPRDYLRTNNHLLRAGQLQS